MRWLTGIGVLAALCVAGKAQQATQKPPVADRVGFIEEVEGKAELRKTPRAAAESLTAKSGPGYKLFRGYQVRCKPKGKITLMLYSGCHTITGAEDGQQVIQKEGSPAARQKDWYELAEVKPDTNRLKPRQIAAITHYFTADEFQRPSSKILYGFTEKFDILRADTPDIRWKPTETGVKMTLTIAQAKEEEGENEPATGARPPQKPLYRKSGIDGTKGRLDGADLAELKEVLLKERDKNPGKRFSLSLITRNGEGDTAIFSLLSQEAATKLTEALEEWKSEKGLLSHLARAGIYLEHKLPLMATDEYDKAVNLYGENVDLLVTAIQLHRSIGSLGGETFLNGLKPPLKEQVQQYLSDQAKDTKAGSKK